MKATYNYIDVLTEIRDFFHRHKMVNSFVDNQVYDFAAKENIYSAVVLVPTTSTLSGEVSTQLNLSFDLYFIDRLTEDNGNAKDVYNDELNIALDFIAYFSNRTGKWNINGDSVSLEPFEQKFSDDLTGGWRLSCSVSIPFRKNVCDIPLYDEDEDSDGSDETFTYKTFQELMVYENNFSPAQFEELDKESMSIKGYGDLTTFLSDAAGWTGDEISFFNGIYGPNTQDAYLICHVMAESRNYQTIMDFITVRQ